MVSEIENYAFVTISIHSQRIRHEFNLIDFNSIAHSGSAYMNCG